MQCVGGDGLEYVAIPKGPGGKHGAVDEGHEGLGLVFRASLELDSVRSDSFFEGLAHPFAQFLKVVLNLNADFRGKAGEFGCEQRGDAKWLGLSSNAAFPVLDIGLEAGEGILDLLGQRLRSLDQSCPMSLEDGDDQVRLGGEVMMDTGFANVDRFSDVGIAEGGVAPIDDEGLGGFGGCDLRFLRAWGIRLPTSR